MIQRLVVIVSLLSLVACTAVSPPGAPVPAARKAPVQKKAATGGGPVTTAPRTTADTGLFDDTPIEILPDEILLVGRIKLSPLLQPEEQEHLPGKLAHLRGKAVMVRSADLEPLPEATDLAAAETFQVTLGEDFLLTLPHDPVALLGGYVFVGGTDREVADIRLHGSWQLDIRPTDRALYIGTIHFVRSAYDTILDYIVEDDYPQAYETYQQRLAEGIILRKALVRWAPGPRPGF